MKVYKLFRQRKDGTLGPLFIGASQRIELGKWLPAEGIPTKGFAFRPGWHSGRKPSAPHLSEKGRVWAECEVKADQWYTCRRPTNQGGQWIISTSIKVNRILSAKEVKRILKK
jgi:hypothetical protein